MKAKHMLIFLVLFGSLYLIGQTYKPNKFTAKQYKDSGLPGHADFLVGTIKKYSEEQADGTNPELSIKIALSMRDFEEKYSSPEDPNFEKAARWYMAQEAMHGKISKEGLKDATGKTFGKPETEDKVIYDDVQGDVIDMFSPQDKPKWLLVHAPIDHTIKNVLRRGDRPLDGVLGKSYIFKYEALPIKGGVDPDHSWTAEEIENLLPKEDWVKKFIEDLGIKDEREYWIYPKKQDQGDYDIIINTRDDRGEQKTIDEIGMEVINNYSFNMNDYIITDGMGKNRSSKYVAKEIT
jgi:hypothetical protein